MGAECEVRYMELLYAKGGEPFDRDKWRSCCGSHRPIVPMIYLYIVPIVNVNTKFNLQILSNSQHRWGLDEPTHRIIHAHIQVLYSRLYTSMATSEGQRTVLRSFVGDCHLVVIRYLWRHHVLLFLLLLLSVLVETRSRTSWPYSLTATERRGPALYFSLSQRYWDSTFIL